MSDKTQYEFLALWVKSMSLDSDRFESMRTQLLDGESGPEAPGFVRAFDDVQRKCSSDGPMSMDELSAYLKSRANEMSSPSSRSSTEAAASGGRGCLIMVPVLLTMSFIVTLVVLTLPVLN